MPDALPRLPHRRNGQPTVGVCQGCGGGTCAAHARIAARSVRRGSPLGAPGTAGARTLLCPVCAAAEAPGAAVLTP
ncbi:hypothetical protein AB0C61_22850 [Streptomyces sp. NPDC048680]|uniref:hypothetical protein n=1 Tax=Streptomyces sp. NPDC048680 TaxID=3155492 RepID=UPI003437C43D